MTCNNGDEEANFTSRSTSQRYRFPGYDFLGMIGHEDFRRPLRMRQVNEPQGARKHNTLHNCRLLDLRWWLASLHDHVDR